MISVPGYKQLELIQQGPQNLVYTGRCTKDNLPVTLRQLRPELTTPELVSRLQREYELLNRIDSEYVIRPIELINSADSHILVTEQPSGKHLTELIGSGTLDIIETASIGCLIAKAIDDLHSYNVVHKDINPANIVYYRKSETSN
ncbi:MAG: protein kinase [Gammaproteobacteria bacterium]|nr:protein kinase [Gammaproteobacteria bacterium]